MWRRSVEVPQSHLLWPYPRKVAKIQKRSPDPREEGSGRVPFGRHFEIIFARPGIGKLIFDSVLTRNYPIVMGSVLITTVIFVACTVVADVVNAIIDPRIRGDL